MKSGLAELVVLVDVLDSEDRLAVAFAHRRMPWPGPDNFDAIELVTTSSPALRVPVMSRVTSVYAWSVRPRPRATGSTVPSPNSFQTTAVSSLDLRRAFAGDGDSGIDAASRPLEGSIPCCA